MDTPVEITLQATVNASGVATVQTATVPPWKSWRLTRVAVACTSTARTQASLYRNTPGAANLLDAAAVSGNLDTTDTVIDLRQNEYLSVQWTGGYVGSIATVTISGTQSDAVS